jgi:hypothetical protein
MNFQEKLFETTADLRARAAALANVAVTTARTRAQVAAQRFEALTVAGREFNKVARRHAIRFAKENSSIAVDAGRDVSALAQTTYSRMVNRPAAARKTTRTSATRKRTTTRKRRVSKAA